MNNDLISREYLKKAIEPYKYATDGVFEGISLIIDNTPTVDIRNKGACGDCEYFNRPITSEPCRNCTLAHGSYFKEKEKVKEDRTKGEWAEFEGGYRCSNCDDIEVYTPNFCPNCGADMRKNIKPQNKQYGGDLSGK